MDTATASWKNKPLKEPEGPLDDSSPGPGCDQLAETMEKKQGIKTDYHQQISGLVRTLFGHVSRMAREMAVSLSDGPPLRS